MIYKEHLRIYLLWKTIYVYREASILKLSHALENARYTDSEGITNKKKRGRP